ncbi:transducin (beta)-like 3 (nucleomorph) [Lotharella oceanica]|uniref:Transducin (Beta)-like 3 n=1 Tax=Lotharella oceanica TaxID=641309 RepID=A0A060DBW4_9EUKA|nr:transducin (beta)-like 3 [Lotharella oceanica]
MKIKSIFLSLKTVVLIYYYNLVKFYHLKSRKNKVIMEKILFFNSNNMKIEQILYISTKYGNMCKIRNIKDELLILETTFYKKNIGNSRSFILFSSIIETCFLNWEIINLRGYIRKRNALEYYYLSTNIASSSAIEYIENSNSGIKCVCNANSLEFFISKNEHNYIFLIDTRNTSLYFMEKYRFIFSFLPILVKKKVNNAIETIHIAPNDNFTSYIIKKNKIKIIILPYFRTLFSIKTAKKYISYFSFHTMLSIFAYMIEKSIIKIWSLQDFSCILSLSYNGVTFIKFSFCNLNSNIIILNSERTFLIINMVSKFNILMILKDVENFRNLSYELTILKMKKKKINLLKIHVYSIRKNTNKKISINQSMNVIIYDIIK